MSRVRTPSRSRVLSLHLQVTFQSPAATPQQLRLLHAPAVNCAFKPLPVQLHITAGDAQQLQHSLSVAQHVHVQRYLKLEMQGLAVPSTAGEQEVQEQRLVQQARSYLALCCALC
jgi:hypothetical protein